MGTISQHSIQANDLNISYFAAGLENDGPLAICLHGFPDSAHTWRHLLPRLADAGYRAVAPFLRGYAPTEVPSDGRFQTAASAMDALALRDALRGGPDSVIIGHDWGAVITHIAANVRPDAFAKVVTMAVPPGNAVGVAFLSNLAQIKRSWYMFFFQHPFADFVVGANDLAYIDMLWADWSPGFDATEELELLKPKIAILDELDSGLDVDALRAVSRRIELATTEGFSGGERLGVLAITHYNRLLEELHPEVVHIFANGQILESGGPEIATRLEETGYAAWVEEEEQTAPTAAARPVVDDPFFSDGLL